MDDNPGISLFQGVNVENELQNQEEAEDLEDQKRRQEEIQNLLTVAMDEFNYDDQSTVNSSTNISADEFYPSRSTYAEQKYRNASFDDQLKVLYEVRVREVQALTEQLEKLKSDATGEKNTYVKKALLLEADKDKAQVSLKQSQALLVNKTEEIAMLHSELATLNTNMKRLEESVRQVSEEKNLCERLNKDLTDQLAVMHSGLTTNTISDRQLQEKHHVEVTQLQTMLDTAHMKLQRKDRECKQLQQNFTNKCNEKDNIVAEKCAVINNLTGSLEGAQQQCRELLQVIDKITQENKMLKLASSNDSLRTAVLTDKTEMIKALQRELARTNDIQNKQQVEADHLQAMCVELSEKCNSAQHKIEQYKTEINLWTTKNRTLEENLNKRNEELEKLKNQLTDYKNMKAENIVYEKKLSVLQNVITDLENKGTADHSIQVSQFSDTLREVENDTLVYLEENEQLKEKLEAAHKDLEILKQNLLDANNQISQLTMTVSLEIEREQLIQTLQEKAVQFEKLITEKHNKPESASIGINTEQTQEKQILQAKYEADLIQQEIKLRLELQKLYDAKLEKIESELSKKLMVVQNAKCGRCDELTNTLKASQALMSSRDAEFTDMKIQRKQDRDAVAMLLDDWRDKFLQLESANREITGKYLEVKNLSDQLASQLNIREAGDSKLYAVIKRECEETIKLWNKHTLASIEQYTLAQQGKIRLTRKKIDECSDYFEDEIQNIEMQFLRKKDAMEQLLRK